MASVRRFYDEADSTREELQTSRFEALRLFDRGNGQRLLDIGCYDGSKTKLIREYLGAERAWGVDFLNDRLDLARERGVDVRTCDLNEDRIEFDDSTFDCIFLGDVVEHVFSPDHLLTESFRLLRPGGYAILTTPNLASWRNRISLVLGWQPLFSEVSTVARLGNPFAPQGLPSGHLRLFTARALVELAQLHGFRVDVCSGYALIDSKPQSPLSRLFRLVDNAVDRLRPTFGDELLARLRKPVARP